MEYGLQDPLGLACDRNSDRVFLSDSRSLIIVRPRSVSASRNKKSAMTELKYPDAVSICPGGSCADTDRRGLAFLDQRLISAEHGNGQIEVRNSPSANSSGGAEWLLSAFPEVGVGQRLAGPAGVAAVEGSLFITDDGSRPALTPKDVQHVSFDRNDRSGTTTGQQSGGAYVCDAHNCVPEPISGPLQHPTGIAAAGAEGPVFIAETDGHEIRWPMFVKSKGKWIPAGLVGSVSIPQSTAVSLPKFLGVALDDSGHTVFAAGPGGLYVFDTDGTVLGRILFDEPVTGIATRGAQVYLAVGHMLCLLTMDESYRHATMPSDHDHEPLAPSLDRPSASIASRNKPRSAKAPETLTNFVTPRKHVISTHDRHRVGRAIKDARCPCRCTKFAPYED